MASRSEWTIDPAILSDERLLEDLLDYDDGRAGRPLRPRIETALIVAWWGQTPRGRELATRLRPTSVRVPPVSEPTSNLEIAIAVIITAIAVTIQAVSTFIGFVRIAH